MFLDFLLVPKHKSCFYEHVLLLVYQKGNFKRFLFCLFQVCGIVIIVCGAVSLHFMKGTGPLIGENYVSAPIALIIIGVAVFLLAFLGCCGASQESYCMLTMVSLWLDIVDFTVYVL